LTYFWCSDGGGVHLTEVFILPTDTVPLARHSSHKASTTSSHEGKALRVK
jgi:hypothetical protein